MKKFILVCTLLLLYSCEKPCGEASTGPPQFKVELIDATTNENVFTSGRFTQSQLLVTTPNSSSFGYTFISENNRNMIGISPAWIDGNFTTYIKLGDQITIPIKSVVYKTSNRCFENYFLKSVEVVGFPYSLETETGIYKIKI